MRSIIPFLQTSEKLSDLPQVTQLVSEGSEI